MATNLRFLARCRVCQTGPVDGRTTFTLSRRYNATLTGPTDSTIATSGPDVLLATTTPVGQPVQNAFRVNAALVLTRAAQITRDPTPFEESFFFYQRRLNERTALPFSRYFYHKVDTPTLLDFQRKVAKRLSASRDVGTYSGYGKDAWNDELLVGAPESNQMNQVNAIIHDAETLEVTEKEIGQANLKNQTTTKLMPRRTAADEEQDHTSLDRHLDQDLYLLVEDEAGQWRFPTRTIDTTWESLRTGAETIVQEVGNNRIHAWMVGNAPVGHLRTEFEPRPNTKTGSTDVGEKTFFMKGRIMAGQVALKDGNDIGAKAFRWLSRDEIKQVVPAEYWAAVDRFLLRRL